MSTKIGPLNQHQFLHPHYGPDNCCLCKAEEKVKILKEFCEKLTKNSHPPDKEIQKLVDEHFWRLM